MNCATCGTSTLNPRFCSRSCSARKTNTETPKRIAATRACRRCHEKVPARRVYCASCLSASRGSSRTLREFVFASDKHPSWRWARIRSMARKQHLSSEQACELCGYKLHVEVAHRRALSTWPLDSLVCDVNSRDNIMLLCPNCHWEYDNLRPPLTRAMVAPQGLKP